MSDFMDMMVDMLPLHSELQKTDNPVRVVLDRSVGEYMDNLADIFDELFSTSATGGWLDCFGRDFGVPRRLEEPDDSYRERIVFEKLEHLTVDNLVNIYGLKLYAYVPYFEAGHNDLTSDNPFSSSEYMAVQNSELEEILSKKFVLGGEIHWFDPNLETVREWIYDVNGENIIGAYGDLYSKASLNSYFKDGTDIVDVKLVLKNATSCSYLLDGCTGLTSVDLSLPSATACYRLLYGCTSLTSVDLSLPNATDCRYLLRGCTSLTSVDLSLPNATDCYTLLYGCTSLTSVNLDLPNATSCSYLLDGCTGLTSVDLSLPNATNCTDLLWGCTSLTSVDLDLPNATNCSYLLGACTSLTSVDLDLPNATNCSYLLWGCTAMKNVTLNLPKLNQYNDIFKNCSNIEKINLTIPTDKVSGMKTYITGLNLTHLTELIINGEEVTL